MQSSIIIKRVTEPAELAGIQTLQQANLKQHLSATEQATQGFVTAEYSLEFLQAMHNAEPSFIAIDNATIVGYALVATRSIASQHPLLQDLFAQIDRHEYKGEQLAGINYVVVGQLCVAKSHRGLGLAQQLYAYYQSCLRHKFRYLITDIDAANERSLKAHQKTGFNIIGELSYGGTTWHIVLWNWNE